MASIRSNPPPTVKGRSGFSIQQAILVLRQGKSHRLWREAAWHLLEHAGKDTQLLLEAQIYAVGRDGAGKSGAYRFESMADFSGHQKRLLSYSCLTP